MTPDKQRPQEALEQQQGREQLQKELEQHGILDEQLRLFLDTHFDSGFFMLTLAYTDKLLNYVSSNFAGCDADEIVQSVLLKAWETLRTYESAKIQTMRFSPWLYTIAHNQAINVLKHNSLLKEVFSLDTPEGIERVESHLHGQAPPLEDEILSQEEREDLTSCIEQLPKAYHLVIILHYYYELPYSEIAQILKKPLNTVKSDGLRATRLLRLKMLQISKE